MKSLLVAFLALASSSAFAIAYNVNTQGTLIDADPSTAGLQKIFPSNTPKGFFYKYDNDGNIESGTAAGVSLFTTTEDSQTKFTITWTGIQPYLTFFYLKAGAEASGGGYMKWDISNFNLGTYTSIEVTNLDNDGIVNQNNGKARNISHVQIDGRPGTQKVPEATSTLALFGAIGAALVAFRRRQA